MLRRLFYAALGVALVSGIALAATGTQITFNGLLGYVLDNNEHSKIPALTLVDSNGNAAVASVAAGSGTAMYPPGATPLSSSSAIVTNANAVATLAGTSGKTTYITGWTCSSGGATSAAAVDLAITGVLGGTIHHSYIFPVGALVPAYPVVEQYNPPLPASAVNTSIVVTLPAGGSGNTSAACNAQGFQL